MSKLLNQNKHFISLILNSSKDQATALIHTLTDEQISTLIEIVLNLLHLPISSKTKNIIAKHKKFFEKIANKRISKATKGKLLKKNYKHILNLLWSVKVQLERLI